ncbi:hypothetical protein WKW79_02495 [Variovorax robiniae]|uniref:DUF2569 domain-containing protein n=1 Tax=Variovorax robiniae TaxID=1836199 RepID=A0ABU8X185_9BURK
MQPNPYSPPQSPLHHDGPPSPARRPVSIWLLLFLLLATTIIFFAGSAKFIWFIASRWADLRDFQALAVGVALRISVAAALLATMLGIFRRRQWGRWLGLLAIASLAAFFMLRPDTTTYANDAESAGGYLGRLVFMPLLFAWWGYAVTFSGKAKRYFSAADAPG